MAAYASWTLNRAGVVEGAVVEGVAMDAGRMDPFGPRKQRRSTEVLTHGTDRNIGYIHGIWASPWRLWVGEAWGRVCAARRAVRRDNRRSARARACGGCALGSDMSPCRPSGLRSCVFGCSKLDARFFLAKYARSRFGSYSFPIRHAVAVRGSPYV